MQNEVLSLRVPAIPEKIEIGIDWIERRNKILIKVAEITVINNQDDYEDAEIFLKKITGASNDAEKLRKKLSQPFADFGKQIKKMGDTAREPLETEKAKLKTIMGVFLRDQEQKRNAELRRIAEEQAQAEEVERKRIEAEREVMLADAAANYDEEVKSPDDFKLPTEFAGEFVPEPEPPAAPAVIETDIGNVHKSFSRAKMVWKFEIENPASIPREFCSPDERKIREYINREKDAASIPGARIWEDIAVQSR